MTELRQYSHRVSKLQVFSLTNLSTFNTPRAVFELHLNYHVQTIFFVVKIPNEIILIVMTGIDWIRMQRITLHTVYSFIPRMSTVTSPDWNGLSPTRLDYQYNQTIIMCARLSTPSCELPFRSLTLSHLYLFLSPSITQLHTASPPLPHH